MQKKIILGCPYTDMRDLEHAINKIDSHTKVINCSQIACVSPNRLYVESTRRWIEIKDFTAAFIRYPYDMIPPHVKTYQLREKTELLKTIALLLSPISLNSVISSWAVRNRLYSLGLAEQFGLLTPSSVIINSPKNLDKSMARDFALCKAIGNCFVSENTQAISKEFMHFLRVEEDDGDTAAIFPASLLSEKDIQSYLTNVPVALLQEYIGGSVEYRGYYINDEFFFYKREEHSSADKSAAAYQETSFMPVEDFQSKFRKYARHINLKYICFDLLSKSDNNYVIIDVNPYGSLPKYSQLPEPTDSLAKALAGIYVL
ncbi:hypothetical protein KAR91_12915 [Candidatus Pacearchaeota archaeon]|nr:hypothetical protein [Candidatus Pacearchaeota archaeon]